MNVSPRLSSSRPAGGWWAVLRLTSVGMLALVTTLFCTPIAGVARAQTITRQGSGMEAMFASQSDGFTASDPIGVIWGFSAGIGPYTAGLILPSLPTPPAPSITPAGGNAFANGGWTSVFNDNNGSTAFTASQVTLDDSVAVIPTTTADVQILFQNWRLQQGPSALGYAYCQVNFGSNYIFSPNVPGLAAAANPAIPLLVSGQTIGLSSYAQFEAVINYDWIPATVNSAGVVTQTGPLQSLGALSYSWSVTGPGPFNLSLPSTGSLAATPTGDGILSLTGFAYVAGDPVDITVTSVPEPSTWVTAACGFACGVFSLLRRRHSTSR